MRLGHRLFVPALVIPFGTLALSLAQPYSPWATLDRSAFTLIALAFACFVATLAALWLTRSSPRNAVGEASRLLDALSLGRAAADAARDARRACSPRPASATRSRHIVAAAIPTDSRASHACSPIAFGMVAFTVIMGNAFAAFPVMMAGIGLPLLIGQHHAHAAALGALGMLTGYCGTLLTPMAANFNIVPAALLELRDPNGVIRAQWPTALVLLAVNFAMLWLFSPVSKREPIALVTGFAPFGGESVNPSQLIAQALHGQTIAGHRVVGATLPTEFASSLLVLNDLLKRHRPALVLAVGQAGGRAEISLERIAVNLIDARIPDNTGAQPIDIAVVENAPNAYFSTLPLKAMLAELQQAGIPAVLSHSAGTFVCNQVFFGLAHALQGGANACAAVSSMCRTCPSRRRGMRVRRA